MNEQQDFCNDMGMTMVSAKDWQSFEWILHEALHLIVGCHKVN